MVKYIKSPLRDTQRTKPKTLRYGALFNSTAISLLLSAGVVVAEPATPYIYADGGEVDVQDGNYSAASSSRAWGVLVYNGSTVNFNNMEVNTTGPRAHGVQVGETGHGTGDDASTINLNGTVVVNTTGNDSFGLHAINGGTINGSANITTTDTKGFGAFAESNSSINLINSTITTNGNHGYGLIANNDVAGAQAGILNATNTDITTNGLHAYGVFADNGGKINLIGGTITTANVKGKGTQDGDGSRGYGIISQGAGSAVTADGTSVHTHGQRAYGAYAVNGGTVELENAAITTEGFMAYGLYANAAGSVLTANNVDVTTYGNVGDAAWAYLGGTLNLNGGTYVVHGGPNSAAGETANGLAALGGTNGNNNGTINADNLNITTHGPNSVGLLAGANVGASATSGTINLSNSSVTVKGEGSEAARVLYGSTLSAQDSLLISEQGAGIILSESATVTLEGTTIKSAEETFVSYFNTADKTQTITVGNGSVATENNGTLLKVNRTGSGGDGEVTLTLAAGSTTAGDIIDSDDKTTGGTDVQLEENASWSGNMKGVRNFSGSQGGSVDFKGPVDIAGSLDGDGVSYSFSSEGGSIGNDLTLSNRSSTIGGTMGTPINVGGNVTIDTTSRFGGNWSIVGDLNSSGIITPGNSIGIIDVGGDLNLDPTSIYNVEVDKNGNSDKMIVGGAADLAGVVVVTPLDGFQLSSPYTILTADSITGTFESASLANPSAFLDTNLNQSDQEVTLSIERNGTSFTSVAQTNNQAAVAHVLDRLPLSNPLNEAILLSSAETATDAFRQLSGDTNASVKTGLIQSAHLTADAINNRLRAAFDGVGATEVPLLSYAKDDTSKQGASDYSSYNYGFWATGFGSWANSKSNSNAGGLKSSTGGFISGVDIGFTDGWRAGFAGGYSKTDLTSKGRSASANSDNWHLGIYGGNQWGAVGLRGGLIHTWHSIDSSRSVSFTGFNDNLNNDYNARTLQAYGELGYRFDTAFASFEPFANLAHVRLHTDGYTENGGAAALTARSDNTNTTFSTLGLRASTPVQLGNSAANLKGTIGWLHSYGDRIPVATQAFTGSESFTVQGVPIVKNAFLLEAGLDISISETSTLGLSYVGQYGNGAKQNGFNTTLNVKF